MKMVQIQMSTISLSIKLMKRTEGCHTALRETKETTVTNNQEEAMRLSSPTSTAQFRSHLQKTLSHQLKKHQERASKKPRAYSSNHAKKQTNRMKQTM